MQSDSAGHIYD